MHYKMNITNLMKEGNKMAAKEKVGGFFSEFKAFAMRGNVVDLAVGVVIGGAFGKITTSVVNDIIFPLLSPFTKNISFENLFIAMDGNKYATLAEATEAGVAVLNYGNLLSVIFNFIVIAFAIFLMVKGINNMHRQKEEAPAPEPEPTTKVCPYCKSEIAIEATRCPHCTSVLEE